MKESARIYIHCWADKVSQFEPSTPEWLEALENNGTCLLPAGHEGPHEWTPDQEVVVQFEEER